MNSLTRLSNFADVYALFFGHETEHGEDGEASVDTGATVECRQHDAVPCTQACTRSTLYSSVKHTTSRLQHYDFIID